jgi:beta-glucanase (GH16 family)
MRTRVAIAIAILWLLPAMSFAAARKNAPCAAWQDTFSTGKLDTSRWLVGNGMAPGYVANQHLGTYDPQNVQVTPGMLRLTLLQTTGTVDTNAAGVLSSGALLSTRQACGYGTYEWTMKMSSTAICATCVGTSVTGSVSAGFLYVNNSQTEIDYEFSGAYPQTIWLVNWLNPTPQKDPTGANETATAVQPFDSTSAFHTYRFVWTAGKISYYIDGVWVADHVRNVPAASAPLMINHWGSAGGWGGAVSVGVVRYLYISRVSFTPES